MEKIYVYAFGVVLLELLTGRKPISNGHPKGKVNFKLREICTIVGAHFGRCKNWSLHRCRIHSQQQRICKTYTDGYENSECYSSDAMLARAKLLADEVGSWHLDVSIDSVVSAFVTFTSNTYWEAPPLSDQSECYKGGMTTPMTGDEVA